MRAILKRNDGAVLAWMAITLLLLMTFVAIAIDQGYMLWAGQQLQIGADAAALAGANYVKSDEDAARAAAVTVALYNTVAGDALLLSSNVDVQVGRFDRDTGVFDSTAAFVNAVRVYARRTDTSLGGPLDLLFGSIIGIDDVNLVRQAIAMTGGGTGTGLLILNGDEECSLFIRGNPTLDLGDGAIQVNSTDPCAICFQGSPDVLASIASATGGICVQGGNIVLPDTLLEGQDPIPDPLYYLDPPFWDEANDLGEITEGGTYSPGYYSGGIDLEGGDTVLEPGIYILDGAGFDIGGNANFDAEGVMFYIIGTGIINLHGTGVINITPPDPGEYSYAGVDTYEGVAIYQAYDNENEGTVLGTSNMTLEGTYYFRNNKINIGGDSTNFGNQFIAGQAEIFGNGTITLASNGLIPAPGNRVFLVR